MASSARRWGVLLVASTVWVGCVADSPQTTDGGSDASTCEGGGAVCGGACVDTRSDPRNCGGCGKACGAGACYGGACDGAKVIDFAAGGEAACAVLGAGEVWCWGNAIYAQEGTTDKTGADTCAVQNGVGFPCRTRPYRVPWLSDAVQVAVGGGHACARRRAGEVVCWGRNEFGETGHAPTTDPSCKGIACTNGPTPVTGLPAIGGGLSVGAGVSCAWNDGGPAWCWGDNQCGSLGVGAIGGSLSGAQQVVGVSSVRALRVASQGEGVCAIETGGVVKCWGPNPLGAAGHDPAGDKTCAMDARPASGTPTPVADAGGPLTNAAALAVSEQAACALLADGAVVCWGTDANGVAPSPAGFTRKPVALPQPGVAIDASYGSVHVMSATGRVFGWGLNIFGELNGNAGTGDGMLCGGQPCWHTPVEMPSALAVALRRGIGSVLVQRADGKLWGWGRGTSGELGVPPSTLPACGSLRCAPSPVAVLGLP